MQVWYEDMMEELHESSGPDYNESSEGRRSLKYVV